MDTQTVSNRREFLTSAIGGLALMTSVESSQVQPEVPNSQQNVFVGFGHCARPVEPDNRTGGYPYEAVFVGFIVFET